MSHKARTEIYPTGLSATVQSALMRLNVPPISELRLQRYHRWILLWLAWFAAFLTQAGAVAPLSRQAAKIAHQWLDGIERNLIELILIRAARQVRTIPTLKHTAHRRRETHLARAIVGAAMRRALRPRDLRRRIAALSQPIAPLAARILRRIPRGLTRRRPIGARPEPRTAFAASSADLNQFCADTS
ncbi:MAG: hypothetical protein KF779_10795 [Hyphomonadaceae bacterium]|nr:hypothetical protein [Hyphomonadaceae bacterium]